MHPTTGSGSSRQAGKRNHLAPADRQVRSLARFWPTARSQSQPPAVIRSVLANTVAQGLAFSPDGTQLATLSRDGRLRLWNARTLQQTIVLDRQVLPASGPVDKLAFSPDGIRLAAASGEGTVRVYVLPIDELVPIARARLLRDFTEQECRQYLHVETCAQA